MGSVNTEDNGVDVHQSQANVSRRRSDIGWQCSRSGLLDRGRFLLENNETLSDVVFVVGKGIIQQEIPAHRFLLAIGSPVFETMFYGPTRQVAEGSDIRLPDIEPASFQNLLRYLYTDDVSQIDDDTVMSTLYAAKKYSLPRLKVACMDFMRANIRPENVFLLLEQAQQSEEDELVKQCLELIDKSTYLVITANEFLDVDYDILAMVLQRDGLSVREIELFNSIERWARQQCKRQGVSCDPFRIRKIIGEVIYDIRFPLMSVDELANGPVQSGILTAEEVKELFLYQFADNKPNIKFSAVLRRGPASQEYTVSRFAEVGGSWGYGGNTDSIQFSADRDVLLLGCGLFGSNDGPSEYVAKLKVHSVLDKKLLLEQNCKFMSDGTKSVFRVTFKQPVALHAGAMYTLSAKCDGPASYHGLRGITKVSAEASGSLSSGKDACSFTFASSPESENGTSLTDGQIPDMFFSLL